MVQVEDTVVVVGDGPTGLSAALLLAKMGVGVHVLGEGRTATDKALLRNYLGIDEVGGPNFMELARLQAEREGAHLHRIRVERVERLGDAYVAHGGGNSFAGRYLVLANGRDLGFAQALGVPTDGDRAVADTSGRTSLPNVYAGGWLTRGQAIQVAISAGDGAAIALDIVARERGKPVHDFDVLGAPPRSRPDRGESRGSHASPGKDADRAPAAR